jgi:hypothetical protein
MVRDVYRLETTPAWRGFSHGGGTDCHTGGGRSVKTFVHAVRQVAHDGKVQMHGCFAFKGALLRECEEEFADGQAAQSF